MDKKDNALELYLNGRIDKDNANETVESVKELLAENPHSALYIDMSAVDSVTDDGLKILKELGESTKNVELRNVTDDIYEVFEKFGLTAVMPITKNMEIEV